MCPMRWWYTSSFRWPEFDLSLPSSVFRWPDFDLSYLTTGWSLQSFRWFDFSLVDDVLWTFVSVVESLALLSMLCFFFVFCGCTL
ncbi:Transmembrane protein [Parasponia andersonii]|uniref:Transmembrane protein n=1 Tax=Parasponia andersonii TaxID=3476 RepID=A0A2P5CV46_PARAD|nr:Transmembrane protein [Parasponia andersonii]